MRTLIKNGTVVTAGDTFSADVVISDGKITAIGSNFGDKTHESTYDEIIDASGLHLLPGGIDAHTHLDMPFGGTTTADDFFTGQRAAAFGGTTTHIDFALQPKDGTLKDGIRIWQERAKKDAVIDYGFHIAITVPDQKMIDEIPSLPGEGVTSLKLFQQYKGLFQVDDTTMIRAMKAAADCGVTIMCHCENGDATDEITTRLVAEGKLAPRYHLEAHPALIEQEASARAIALASITGCKLYIVHMSCEESVMELALGRARGVQVMGETCTQYMFKFEDDMKVEGHEGAKWACGPPVRKPKDAEFLFKSLANSTLQVVATDHCSFNYEGGVDGKKPGKELGKEGFHTIPNGIPGIEDRLIVMHHAGVNGGRFDLNRFVAITATNPAKSFGLYPDKGSVMIGADADIVLWDMAKEHTMSAKTHHMNVDYSAYEGMKVKGMPVRTFLRGKTIMKDGEFLAERGSGRYVRRGFGQIL
jgi:dihydropyrimidinase